MHWKMDDLSWCLLDLGLLDLSAVFDTVDNNNSIIVSQLGLGIRLWLYSKPV